MKRLLLTLLFILLGVTVLSGCNSAKETSSSSKQELKKFNIGYLASPGHVLYFVAKEKGYFAEEGLDVNLFLFNNSGEGMNAIQSGKLDAGSFGTTAPLKFIANGSDFTLFGGQMNDGSGIVTKPERAAEFKELKNFKGKKIATVKLSTVDVVVRAALLDAGIDWKKDLTIVEMDSPAAVMEAVKKGVVDAGMVWVPHLKNAEKLGLKAAIYSGEIEKMHSCCRQVTLTANIQKDPKTYENFLRALIKAYKFYQTNHEETVDIISKYVKVDKEVIVAETYGGHLYSSPDPGKEGTLMFWKNMNKIGYINSNLNIEDKINLEIYKKAIDSILKENPNDSEYLKLKSEFKE